MAVIDLTNQPGVADSASKGIIKIIDAMASAKQSEVELKKQVLLHQINQKMDRQNKIQEQQDEMKNWGSMFGTETQAQPGTPAAVPGKATSATPDQIGTPGSPVSPIGGAMPAGYTPPMTMADPSQQPANNAAQMSQAQPQQPQMPDISPIQENKFQVPSYEGQPLPSAMELVRGDKLSGQKTDANQLRLYHQLWQQAGRGQATEEGLKKLATFAWGDKLVSKGDISPLQGIDTINLSPDQVGEALKAKNPGHYNFLESIKNGQYKITGRSSKEMNKVVEQIQTIWPGTDLQALQARYDVRKDFTSGKTSNNITALNTALSHLDKLATSADTLDNGSFRFGNKLGNVLKTQTGDSRVRVLNSDIHAVTGELANTFKQTGATDTEIKNFQHSLDAADSKEVLHDVVNEFIGLIGGRTQPLLERYQNAFGPDSSFPVVGRHGQAVLDKHGFEWNPSTGEVLRKTDAASGGDTSAGGGQIMTATNPKTGQKITSKDGGQTWQ